LAKLISADSDTNVRHSDIHHSIAYSDCK